MDVVDGPHFVSLICTYQSCHDGAGVAEHNLLLSSLCEGGNHSPQQDPTNFRD